MKMAVDHTLKRSLATKPMTIPPPPLSDILKVPDSEPPRLHRRVICSTTGRPYRVCSGLHRTPPMLLRGDVSDRAEQAAIVIPIDPFQGFPFDFAHRFPWTDLVDALPGMRLPSIAKKDFGFEDMEATVAPVGPRKRRNG